MQRLGDIGPAEVDHYLPQRQHTRAAQSVRRHHTFDVVNECRIRKREIDETGLRCLDNGKDGVSSKSCPYPIGDYHRRYVVDSSAPQSTIALELAPIGLARRQHNAQ